MNSATQTPDTRSRERPLVERENSLRIGEYRKDAKMEQRFARMNLALSAASDEIVPCTDYPTLFVFGLPRSGTDADLPANFSVSRHRVRKQPDGTVLAFSIVRNRSESNGDRSAVQGRTSTPPFGVTKGPHGPHEFGYFWNHWLKISDLDDLLDFGHHKPDVDWAGLGQVIRSMQGMFGSGIVFKTIYAGSYIQAFSETFAMPMFIYIERDPVDVALSILKGRMAYYGRASAWWSTYPPNYHALAELPFDRQIAGQVHSLRNAYEETMQHVCPELVFRLSYLRLCEDPAGVMSEIRDKVKEVHGVNLKTRLDPPERFKFHTRPASLNEDQETVVDALRRWKSE